MQNKAQLKSSNHIFCQPPKKSTSYSSYTLVVDKATPDNLSLIGICDMLPPLHVIPRASTIALPLPGLSCVGEALPISRFLELRRTDNQTVTYYDCRKTKLHSLLYSSQLPYP